MNNTIDFELRGELITLDALLKATGLASSGGVAKVMIGEGAVRVNGEVETRRGRKLRAGDTVGVAGVAVVRVAAAQSGRAIDQSAAASACPAAAPSGVVTGPLPLKRSSAR